MRRPKAHTGLKHPCSNALFLLAGEHRGEHGTSSGDTFEQRGHVDLVAFEHDVGVGS
jgi:hypothetical protein